MAQVHEVEHRRGQARIGQAGEDVRPQGGHHPVGEGPGGAHGCRVRGRNVGRGGGSLGPTGEHRQEPRTGGLQARLGDRERDHPGMRGHLDGEDQLAVAGQTEVGPVQGERQRPVGLRGEHGRLGLAGGPRRDGTQDGPLVGRADPVQRVGPACAHPRPRRGLQGRREQGLGARRRRGGVLAEAEVGHVAGVGGHRVHGRQRLRDRGLEAIQQVGDGLVDGGDPGHRHRAGDDQDLVGVVEVAVRLPQGVRLVPATHVGVDHRNERDRLAGRAHDGHEVGDVGRVDQRGARGRVRRDQRGERRRRVVDRRGVGEQRLDPPGVGGVQPGLGLLEQGDEPAAVGDVEPGAVLVAPVAPEGGEGDEALQHLGVGHLGHVAEVRLGRGGQGVDDPGALGLHRSLVTGHGVQQPGGTGGAVVQEVDVGVEPGAPGGRPTGDLAPGDPAVVPGRGGQGRLHRRGRRRLPGGHRDRPEQDGVHGHGRGPVGVRPRAGEQGTGPLRVGDPAADRQDHVLVLADQVVGGQQELVEVLPRVVAAGHAALQVDPHRVRGVGRDRQDLLDLGHRAGLERVEPDARGGQLVEQGQGLGLVGDARGDGQPVDRGPGGARPLDEPLATDLQVPQVRVEVEGVDHDLLPRLETLGHLGDPLGEDALGDLAATGELGDMPAVGRGHDDRGLDGGGGHAGQDHRGAPRPPRVQVGQAQLAGGVTHHARCEALVGLRDRGGAAPG